MRYPWRMIILLLQLAQLSFTAKPVQPVTAPVAQFQTCVWPHKCVKKVEIAQFRPCVWPNTCSNRNS